MFVGNTDIPPAEIHHIANINSEVNNLVSRYVETRDLIDPNFFTARAELRASYCNANLSSDVIANCQSALSSDVSKADIERRLNEWNNKAKLGLLSKNENPALSESEFIAQVQEFYSNHEQTLTHQFADYDTVKTNLRAALLPALKEAMNTIANFKFGMDAKPLFESLDTDTARKSAIIEDIGHAAAKNLGSTHNISDEELLKRIANEWSWKAIS